MLLNGEMAHMTFASQQANGKASPSGTRQAVPARGVLGRSQPSTALSRSVRHHMQQRQAVASSRTRPMAFSNVDAPPSPQPLRTEKVEDVMTRGTIHCVHPDTSVDQALELLVSNSVTGMPVLDDDGKVVGVVSDYDLLSLEGIAEKAQLGTHMFPELDMEWNTFRSVQRLISKNAGKTVADVMTEDPLVVRPNTNMATAAKVLLDQKVRRLPVVDENGRLVGIFTRRDVIKAALATRKAAEGL